MKKPNQNQMNMHDNLTVNDPARADTVNQGFIGMVENELKQSEEQALDTEVFSRSLAMNQMNEGSLSLEDYSLVYGHQTSVIKQPDYIKENSEHLTAFKKKLLVIQQLSTLCLDRVQEHMVLKLQYEKIQDVLKKYREKEESLKRQEVTSETARRAKREVDTSLLLEENRAVLSKLKEHRDVVESPPRRQERSRVLYKFPLQMTKISSTARSFNTKNTFIRQRKSEFKHHSHRQLSREAPQNVPHTSHNTRRRILQESREPEKVTTSNERNEIMKMTSSKFESSD